MLSFAKISADSKYYLDGESYYTRDTKPAFTEWFGKGAERLGLKGAVTASALDAMYEGKLPNGECIARNLEGKRRPGYDLTFSLPKSLSQLMLAGGDYRIYGLFQHAIKDTIKEMEKDHAQARVTVDGQVNYEKTGNLTVALVNHFTSRAGDPQGHCHALFMNNTQTADGKWRALASSSRVDKTAPQGFFEAMFAKRSYYESCFNASLAKGCRSIGLTPVSTGNHSHFEVAEVPEEARRVQSKRREQIEEALSKYSVASAKMGDIAAVITRPDKVIKNPAELTSVWQTELASSVNFSISSVTREYMAKAGLTPMTLSDAMVAMPDKVMEAPSSITFAPDDSQAQKQSLANAVLPHLKQAMTDLSVWQVAFSMEVLTERVLRSGQGEVTLSGVKAGIEMLLENGTLLPAGRGGQRLTTQANLEAEAALKQRAIELVNTPHRLRTSSNKTTATRQDSRQIDGFSESASLSVVNVNAADQREWLQQVLHETEAKRQSVRILSPTRLQTVEGNESIKRQATNLIGWVMNQFKAPPCETVAGYLYRAAEENRTKPQLLIVQEANRLRLPDAQALMTQAKATGSQLLLLNHEKGLGTRTGSDVMTLLNDAGVEAKFSQPSRPMAVPTVTLLDAKSGLQTGGNPEIRIITDRKKQVEPLTQTAREQYREAGVLGSEQVTTTAASLVFIKNEEDYRAGQTVRLLGRYGQDASITQVNRTEKQIHWRSGRQHGTLSFEKLAAQPHLILEKSPLALSSNDWLVGTFTDRKLGIEQGKRYQVKKIDEKRVSLTDGKKQLTLRHDQVTLPLAYDYVRTLDNIGHTPAEKVIFKASNKSLSSNVINRLSEVASGQIDVLTDNVTSAAKRLTQAQTRQTSMALVLEAANSSGTERQLFTPATFLRASEFLRTTRKVPAPTAEAAIHYAMDKALEKEAGVSFSTLITTALDYFHKIGEVGKVDHADIEKKLSAFIESDQLLKGCVDGKVLYTTPAMLETESAIITSLDRGIGAYKAGTVTQSSLEHLPDYLTAPQREAAEMILTTKDRFVAVPGFAGTGKSTLWTAVQSVLEKNGSPITILGLAPTNQAVAGLKEKGLTAQTLQSFLIDQRKAPKDLSKTLVVVDEASQVANQAMAEVISHIELAGGRCVFQGDTTQYLSIEAAKMFSVMLAASKMARVENTEIMRQQTESLQQTVGAIIERNPTKQLAIMNSTAPVGIDRTRPHLTDTLKTSVIDTAKLSRCKNYQAFFEKDEKGRVPYEQQNAAVIDAAVDDYLSRTDEARTNTCFVVSTHEDANAINHGIRTGLAEEGKLTGAACHLPRLMNLDCAEADLKLAASYQSVEGEAGQESKKVDVVVLDNKDYYTVSKVDLKSGAVILKQGDQERCFFPSLNRRNVALYAYARKEDAEIQVGDNIRLTKSDREKNLFANQSLQIQAIEKDHLLLQSKDGERTYELSRSDPLAKHWAHDYCLTGFSSQSKTDDHVIALMLAWRRLSVTDRYNLVAITRAAKSAILYTTDQAELIEKRLEPQSDKISALEVKTGQKIHPVLKKPTFRSLTGPTSDSHRPVQASMESVNPVSGKTKALSGKPPLTLIDVKNLKEQLLWRPEQTCQQLLGQPNTKLSTGTNLRYGNHGSLSVSLKPETAGQWMDFETGEKGDIIALIQYALGLGFREALLYAERMTGGDIKQPVPPKLGRERSAETTTSTVSATQQYAEKLIAESVPITGTLAESYLRNHRGITRLPDESAIRFHPNVSTGEKIDDKTQYAPAMLAIATSKRGNAPNLQATYLNPDTAEKLGVALNKRTYGPFRTTNDFNHCTLLSGKDEKNLTVLAEGVETALSLATVLPDAEIIATLSKGNLCQINPDALHDRVLVALDNDGQNPEEDKTIQQALARLIDAQKEVYTLLPEKIDGKDKVDFNDVLTDQGIDGLKQSFKQLERITTTESEESLPQDQQIKPEADPDTTKNSSAEEKNQETHDQSTPNDVARQLQREAREIY